MPAPSPRGWWSGAAAKREPRKPEFEDVTVRVPTRRSWDADREDFGESTPLLRFGFGRAAMRVAVPGFHADSSDCGGEFTLDDVAETIANVLHVAPLGSQQEALDGALEIYKRWPPPGLRPQP
jgi:hypothetical protein